MITLPVNDEIQLRNFVVEDAQQLFALVNENRAHLRRWFAWVDETRQPKHSLDFIEQSLNWLQAREGFAWAILYNNQIIGSVGMMHWNHQLQRAQVGYWLVKEFEGKGIVNKSLVALLNYIFEQLAMNKVEIHFIPANTRSAAVASRLGAKTEGILRESYLLHGKLEDLVITGILKSEWLNKKV